mgnify:CR=1 FL=1
MKPTKLTSRFALLALLAVVAATSIAAEQKGKKKKAKKPAEFKATCPVLGELFASRIFFSERARSGLIKSPLDLVLGAHRALGGG